MGVMRILKMGGKGCKRNERRYVNANVNVNRNVNRNDSVNVYVSVNASNT